jgi:hypothetical protein
MPIVAKLAELGTGAWIALTIIGFIIWWPVGLALLAFTVGSGRMAYRSVARWQEKMELIQDTVGFRPRGHLHPTERYDYILAGFGRSAPTVPARPAALGR